MRETPGADLSTYEMLEQLGTGLHHCGLCAGWIQVKPARVHDGAKGWDVLWCSGEHHHQPLNGPAYAADFHEDGTMRNPMKSAITMWPVRNEEQARYCRAFLKQKIHHAWYKQHKRKK